MDNVAIITPFFNTEDYLHRCITSILSQRNVTLRLFLIDDGSTDHSASIAQFYADTDHRVSLIRTTNIGQGGARNLALQRASSEFVYFVDSDDHLGENALSILYNTAINQDLDVCSPWVPEHYFSKPLEFIPCLPCKSQFIRHALLSRYAIKQPLCRSGQDGVFSHLVLAHANRIGMAKMATFHYTHAREGSTFATYLNKPEMVPSLLDEHYTFIDDHYTKQDLWNTEGLRLLNFITDESLRNRVLPHLAKLTEAQLSNSLATLTHYASKAYKSIPPQHRVYLSPIQIAVATEPPAVFHELLRNSTPLETDANHLHNLSLINNNITAQDLIICQFSKLAALNSNNVHRNTHSGQREQCATSQIKEKASSSDDKVSATLIHLHSKIDYLLNVIHTSIPQITSAIKAHPLLSLAEGDQQLIFSLTTTEHRLPLVHLALESLFSQSVRPHRIILWISDRIPLKSLLTPQLQMLIDKGLDIRQVRDVGPHTKLVYALSHFPDKTVITFDDDVIYPHNTAATLLQQHKRWPAAVVANWARELCFDHNRKVLGIREGRLLTPPLLELELESATAFTTAPNMLAFAYGTGGVLYPPGSVNDRVQDVSTFSRLCPTEDDIWFKAMTVLNAAPVVVTNLGINPKHHTITAAQSAALRHDNHGSAKHLGQMRAVFEHYDLYALLNV